MEHDPLQRSPELPPELRYRHGWHEILIAPDAIDYQLWLEKLVLRTSEALHETEIAPDWAENEALILRRWLIAMERIADMTISPDDLQDLTEAEVVETALLTFRENIENIGWVAEGVSFIVPNLYGDADSEDSLEGTIDLTTLD